MKKSTLVVSSIAGTLVLLLTAALVGLPFWLGMEAEKTYQTLLERASRSSGFQVKAKTYERGWFRSTAETLISYPGLPLEFTAAHKIDHGPFPLKRWLQGEFSLTPIQARIESEIRVAATGQGAMAALPPLTTDLTIGLHGDGRLRIKLPPTHTKGADGVSFDWRGVAGDIDFDREWKQFRTELQSPGFAVNTTADKSAEVSVSNITFRSNLREGVAGYLFGDNALAIGQMNFQSPAAHVTMQEMEIAASTRAAGESVNMVLDYKIRAIDIATEHYGPSQVTVELRKLDVATLMKFRNEMEAIHRKDLPPAQASLMTLGKSMELIGALAKKAPELEITRMSFKTAQGELQGKGKLVLDGSKVNIAENPMLVLTALSGNFELSIPPGMVRQILAPLILSDIESYRQAGSLSARERANLDPATMAKVVDQALPLYLAQNPFTRNLVLEKDMYKLRASIRRGQLLVNDTPWHGAMPSLPQ
jgi:uncharacterized protein YdgA (DUF945 family)